MPEQSSQFCEACGQQSLHERPHLSFGVGCLGSILTAGLFIPFWILIAIVHALTSWRCQACGASRRDAFGAFLVGLMGFTAVAVAVAVWMLWSTFAGRTGSIREPEVARGTRVLARSDALPERSVSVSDDEASTARLRAQLERIANIGMIVETESVKVRGPLATVVVGIGWRSDDRESAVAMINTVWDAWKAARSGLDAELRLIDSGDTTIGGASAAKGAYLVE